MRVSALLGFVLSVGLTVLEVSAAATEDPQSFPVDSPMPSDVPANCTEMCMPVANVTATGTCTTIQCCTKNFTTAYFDCLDCVGHAENVTDYTPAQNALDTLIAACGIRKFNDLPHPAFPGQDANRTIATSALLSSASSAFAATASTTGPSTVTAGPPTATGPTGSQPVTITSNQPSGTDTSPPSGLASALNPNIVPMLGFLAVLFGLA